MWIQIVSAKIYQYYELKILGKRGNMGRFKEFIRLFTYKGKRECAFKEYIKMRNKYINMDALQLNFEYVTIKSEYEHKKNVMTIFTIAIALSIIMGVWNKFFEFMKMVFKYSTVDNQMNSEVIIISFIVSMILLAFTTFIILYIIYLNGKQIKTMREKIIIIEQIMNDKKDRK